MKRRSLWGWLALSALVPSAYACSVGMDPAIVLDAVSPPPSFAWHSDFDTPAEVCAYPSGFARAEVNEGEQLHLRAFAVDGACNPVAQWTDIAKWSGSLKVHEMFSDPADLMSFVAKGESAPAPDEFTWNVGGSIPPINCDTAGNCPPLPGNPIMPGLNRSGVGQTGMADFQVFGLDLELIAGNFVTGTSGGFPYAPTGKIPAGAEAPTDPNGPALGDITITAPTIGPSGNLIVRLDLVHTYFHVNKLGAALSADFSAYAPKAPTVELGFNPRLVPVGLTPVTPKTYKVPGKLTTPIHAGEIQVTFDTPSHFGPGPIDWTDGNHYTILAETTLGWGFSNVRIPIGWAQVVNDPSPDPGDSGLMWQQQGNFYIDIGGAILHKGNATGGAEGHPAMIQVAVRDTSPAIAAAVLGTEEMDALAGQAPNDAGLSVVTWDNNPRAALTDYELDAWYLAERSRWEKEPSQLPPGGDNATYLANFAGDEFAYSPGHDFRWVPLVTGLNPSPIGGGATDTQRLLSSTSEPLGTQLRFDLPTITEPTSPHFVPGTAGTGGAGASSADGNYATYPAAAGERPYKVVYRIRDLNAGVTRPALTPADPANEDLTMDIVDRWVDPVTGLDQMTADYTTTGPPQTAATNSSPAHQELLDQCNSVTGGICNNGGYYFGLPRWGVTDDLPPSLVLTAWDKKYNKVYYFGHGLLGDATCTGGSGCDTAGVPFGKNAKYFDVLTSGTTTPRGVSPTTLGDANTELVRIPAASISTTFDDAGDYLYQRSNYLSDRFYPAAQNIYSNSTNSSLWIDEDTRVEFFLTAWDNGEGWDIEGPTNSIRGAGIPLSNITFELVDEPTTGNTTPVITAPGEYMFRNPNQGSGSGTASVFCRAIDPRNGQTTEFTLTINIADNSLRIFSLQEQRQRQ